MRLKRRGFGLAGGASVLALLCLSPAARGQCLTPHPGVVAESAESTHPALGPVHIDAPIITRHTGTFSGKTVTYDGVVEPFITLDLSGKPAAKLVSTSYIVANERSTRPILFVFNGGPIDASTPLHMGMFGPKRIAVPDDISADPATFQVVDNQYAPLDVADVVIFDPANTGYSRTLPGIDPQSQFSTVADARQLAQLVNSWVKSHHREGSPLYLVGESYGTIRAPEAARQLQQTDTPLSGLILLGQAVNIIEYAQRRDNVISYAVSLPTLAAIGWWHHKVDRKGRSFDEFLRAAQAYGAGEYLQVLFLGNRSGDQRMSEVAQRLQEFTGLSAEVFLKSELKVSKAQYQLALFPGCLLDANDARYIRPLPPAEEASFGYDQAAIAHFHSFLGVPENVGDYFVESPNPPGLNDWDWDQQKSPFGDWPWVKDVRDIMSENPKFRVLVGNGLYDTQTTIGAMDYLVAQSSWPKDRVRTRYFQGGHMMYTVEASAKTLSEEVRAMMNHAW